MLQTVKNYIQSLFLWELFKGLQLTFIQAQDYRPVSGGENAIIAPVSGVACVATLSQRRRTLHRL
jgi:hypothetical protein